MPVQFSYVSGTFDVSYNQLITLKGSPLVVGGNFFCSNNQLKTLEGVSPKIGNYLDFSANYITNLHHCPKRVKILDCSNNPIQIDEPIELSIEEHLYHQCYSTNNDREDCEKIKAFINLYEGDGNLHLGADIFNDYIASLKEKKRLEKVVNINKKQISKRKSKL